MKRTALVLALLATLLMGATPNKGTGGGGGGSPQSPWASDIDPATFSVNGNSLLAADGNPAVGANRQALNERTVNAGPLWICTTGSSSFDQNSCNDNADCGGGGVCGRNPSVDSVFYDSDGMEPSVGAAEPLNGTQWLGVDGVYKFFKYNRRNVSGSAGDDTDYASFEMQLESDFRPAASANVGEERLLEWILQVFPAAATPLLASGEVLSRPWFLTVNHHPNHIDADAYWLNAASLGIDAGMSYSVANLRGRRWKLATLGASQRILPALQVGYQNTVPSGAGVEVNISDQLGTDSPMQPENAYGSSWDSSTSAQRQGVSVKLVQSRDSPQASQGFKVNLTQGINIYGACDGNGTEAVGTPCWVNEECNNGNRYDGAGNNGICVKGNGVASNGTNDGICVQDASGTDNDHDCASVQAWLADSGTCRSAPSGGSGAITISSLCDNLGGACDTTGTCIETATWFVPNLALPTTFDLTAELERGDQSTNVSTSDVFGYCQGTTNAWEEGVVCTDNADCTDSCEKPFLNPITVQSMYAGRVTLDVDADRNEANADATTSQGAFNVGTREVGRLSGIAFQMSGDAPSSMYVAENQLLDFESPSVTGTPSLFNASLIRVRNVQTSTVWQPNILKVDAQTARANIPSFSFVDWGHDNGYWLLEDARLWSEAGGTGGDATANRIRVKFDSNPSSHNDGAPILTGEPLTTDPCGSAPEGLVFYNDTSDYFCFCNGAGNDVQMHSPATACF